MDNIELLLKQAEIQHKTIQLNLMFNKNMEFFKTAIPSIYEKYKKFTPEKIQLTLSSEGYINLINTDLNDLPVYPKDPEIFSKETVESYALTPLFQRTVLKGTAIEDPKLDIHIHNLNEMIELFNRKNSDFNTTPLAENTEFLLMLGIGLGYQVTELLKKTDIRHLCIVETHEDIFYASLHTLDWQALNDHFDSPYKSLNIIVGQPPKIYWGMMTQYIHQIGIFSAAKPYIFTHLTSSEMTTVSGKFLENLPALAASVGYYDDERVGLSHTMNNFRNKIPFLVNHAFLVKKFENKPVFLIGNGPSLDLGKEFIKANIDKAIVISCGSSLSSLYKMGIKPDFHVELERTNHIREWIDTTTPPEYRKGITLLAVNTVHPELPNLFDQTGMALKYNDLGASYIEQFISDEKFSVTLGSCNPTVSNTGLAFAAALGFLEIYLFGIDLGFPAGEQHHSSHSFHYDIKEEDIESFQLDTVDKAGNFTIDGNFGDKIISTNLYMLTKKSMEEILFDCKEIQCYNTAKGALIEKTIPKHIEDIDTSSWQKIDKPNYCQHVFDKNFSNTHFKKMPGKHDIIKSFRPAILILKEIEELYKQDIKHTKEGIEILNQNHGIMEKFRSNLENTYCYKLLKGSSATYMHMMAKCLYTNNSEQDGVDTFNEARKFYLEYLTQTQESIKNNLFDIDYKMFNMKEKLKQA